jgi:hypothetical protein
LGYESAYCNTGNCVLALGLNAGACNAISTATIVSNSVLPSYLDYATASAAITILAGGVAGNTYFYHDQTINAIGSVRL